MFLEQAKQQAWIASEMRDASYSTDKLLSKRKAQKLTEKKQKKTSGTPTHCHLPLTVTIAACQHDQHQHRMAGRGR